MTIECLGGGVNNHKTLSIHCILLINQERIFTNGENKTDFLVKNWRTYEHLSIRLIGEKVKEKVINVYKLNSGNKMEFEDIIIYTTINSDILKIILPNVDVNSRISIYGLNII